MSDDVKRIELSETETRALYLAAVRGRSAMRKSERSPSLDAGIAALAKALDADE